MESDTEILQSMGQVSIELDTHRTPHMVHTMTFIEGDSIKGTLTGTEGIIPTDMIPETGIVNILIPFTGLRKCSQKDFQQLHSREVIRGMKMRTGAILMA